MKKIKIKKEKNIKYDSMEIIPIEKLEQKFYSEFTPFDKALDVYKTNLLYIIMDLISKEIMRLTKAQKEIIIRYFFNSESKRKIAKSTGKDPSSIRDLRCRALSTLYRRLSSNPYFMEVYNKYKECDPSISLISKIMNELEKND